MQKDSVNCRGNVVATLVLLATLAPLVQRQARGAEEAFAVQSPDGSIEVRVALDDRGRLSYGVVRQGRTLVRPSRLGVILGDGDSFDAGLAVAESAQTSYDETWIQPWGEKKSIRNHYRELRLVVKRTDSPQRRMDVVFRLFNDGVGFRYEWPEQEELGEFQIVDELTEFRLAEDCETWWIPAYQGNRYEFLYQRTPLSAAPRMHTPVTMRTADGLHLSIHEAALADYASMTLARAGDTTLTADLTPWSDGVKVRAAAPHRSPWRTIQMSPTAGGLITSYLILNLNDPNVLGDVDWIQPGKYAGVWWEMHLGSKTWGPGPNHGATTENVKKHIDFAAENGFLGVLAEGWNYGWEGDWAQHGEKFQFTAPYPDFDIREITRYAAERGVRLIGHHETAGAIINYEGQLNDALDYYAALGINAVKTGYVAHGTGIKRLDDNLRFQGEWHHGQHMVRHYRKVIEAAAKRRMVLNVHEPIKDTGERRTYPNMMTREGARGQEYEAWSEDGGNPPDHTTILPFTRMLAGPMDYCPGIFDLQFEEHRPNNRINTTLAKQLALYVVLYSPLQMVPDLPENYARRPDAFEFIRDVPADWEDTRAVNGAIGDYVTIARQERDAKDWYIGSVTDEEARELQAPLDFLPEGVEYEATIYEDGPDADWRQRPLSYRIRRETVRRDTVLSLSLAAGGGAAVRLTPASPAAGESAEDTHTASRTP